MARSRELATDTGSAPQPALGFLSRLAHSPTPKPWLAYAAAVVATALAAALRWWLGTLVGASLPPFITFYPVVMLAALLGGAGPGLFATALSALAVADFFLPPTGSFAVANPADQVGLAIFSAINIAVIFICAALRTARHRTFAEAQHAQASEVRYRRLFEAAKDGVLLLDPRTRRITDANPYIAQLLGYAPDQLVGKELWEIGLLKDAETSRTAFRQLAQNGYIRYDDLPLQATTGEIREVEFVSNLYDEDGRSVIQCNIRDITDRKRAQATLTKQAQLIQLSPTATIARTIEGLITFWSAGAQTLYGWTPAEAIGHTTHDLLHTQFPKPLEDILTDLHHHGYWSGELRHRTKHGTEVTVESHWLTHLVPGSQAPELLESNLDITSRKQAELALAATRDRLAAELDAMNRLHDLSTRFLQQDDPYALLNTLLDTAISTVGAQMGHVHLLERSTGELPIAAQRGLDDNFLDYFSHIKSGQIACGTAIQTSQCVVVEDVTQSPLFRADAPALQLKLAARIRAMICTPLLAHTGQAIGVLSIDFHEPHRPTDRDLRFLDLLARLAADSIERSQAEAALRKSERQFRALAESVPQLAWATDAQGQVNYVNDRWRAYTGQGPDASYGTGWLAAIHPEEQPRALERWTAAASTGQIYEAEYRLRRHDGHYRWFLARGAPARDPRGRIERWFGTCTDIDDQKRTLDALRESEKWLALTKDQLARSNRDLDRTVQERTAKLRETVAELEGFSYSLVHDMRAPLRAMLSYAGILEFEAGQRFDARHADFLRKIKLAAVRMDQLVTDSLNYSRILRQDLPLGPVNLAALIRGLVETYPNLQPPHAGITVEIADLIVHGNQAALTQVFSNLLGNAVKFVAPGVHPHVRVWAELRPTPGPPDSRPSVLVWVEDNGIGIPRDQQERVFGMFERMHRPDEYPGTGIGLAIVRKSLDRTGGQVCLDSEPGRGSRFCVLLPLAHQDHQAHAE